MAPTAVIGRFCQIGRDCYVGPGAVVQATLAGNRVIIHAGAKIGQDGFGFTTGVSGPERIPQIGRVVIQDNVEIGANSTVDRGAMADTVIGENSKIDNLVQIGHNVRIGRNCLIAGLSRHLGFGHRGGQCGHGRRRRHCRSLDHRRRLAACGGQRLHEQRAGGRDLGRLPGRAHGDDDALDSDAQEAYGGEVEARREQWLIILWNCSTFWSY